MLHGRRSEWSVDNVLYSHADYENNREMCYIHYWHLSDYYYVKIEYNYDIEPGYVHFTETGYGYEE